MNERAEKWFDWFAMLVGFVCGAASVLLLDFGWTSVVMWALMAAFALWRCFVWSAR